MRLGAGLCCDTELSDTPRWLCLTAPRGAWHERVSGKEPVFKGEAQITPGIAGIVRQYLMHCDAEI